MFLPIRERGDDALCLLHVHRQSGIANIGSDVIDDGSLQNVIVSGLLADIGKGIGLLELREVNLLSATSLVVVGMAIEQTEIGIETMG